MTTDPQSICQVPVSHRWGPRLLAASVLQKLSPIPGGAR